MMRAKAVTSAVNRSINQAQSMRDSALSVAMKRKEEFLGARVPKELRDKVTARANERGIPVSILIRNILEEAFNDSPSTAHSARSGESPVHSCTLQDAQMQPPEALTHPCAPRMDAQVSRESEARGPGCRERPTRFPAVLGWEMIRLNRQVDCSCCGKQLLPGASVTLGLAPELVQASATHIILCDQCERLM